MKYKAIIFDMDGTIIETEHIWDAANKNIINKRNLTVCPTIQQEIATQVKGLALPKSCLLIKNILELDDSLEDLITETSHFACELYEREVRFIDGFLKFHREATQKYNLKVGLATNADTQTLTITDKKLNLKNLFGEHLYNISHVNEVCKPNPDLYLHAAKKLNLDPQECIAIEDSAHGIQAAQSAGIFCIGINSANTPEQLSKAHFTIDTYDEIDLPRLLKIPKK